LAQLQLTAAGFGKITQFVAEVANSYCEGKLVSVLEGGYNLTALADSVAAHVEKLIAFSLS
jgi:acetoin utilization deacetylase AcuC-like enzyme